MKHNISINAALMLLLAAGISSCSDKEVYDSSVVRNINITLNGNPWSIYYGTTNKPIFIYHDDGSYFANYSMLYNFKLDNGKYKVIATTQTDLIVYPDNLNTLTISQDSTASMSFGISPAVEYVAGESLNLPMETRTGVLRLRATDEKADMRYSTVRAVVNSPISAYKISDCSFEENGVEIVSDKTTASGGVSYSNDLIMLETATNNKALTVRIDYIDDAGDIINSKEIDGEFTIYGNDTTIVSFSLNNAEEGMIQDYTVHLASEGWTDETLEPEAPTVTPDGYTYVSPSEDINTIIAEQLEDSTIEAVKLYLKAGATYTVSSSTLSEIEKSLEILGQATTDPEEMATLNFSSVSMVGDIDYVRFENLIMVPGSRMFNLKNQEFHVGEIALVGCWFDGYSGTLWYQQSNADYQQIVDTLRMEDTRFMNLTIGSSALVGLTTKVVAPIYNWIFDNCTFHIVSASKPIVNNTSKIDETMTATINHCTIATLSAGSVAFFEFNGTSTNKFYFTATDNIIAGTGGSATAINVSMTDTQTLSGNYYTSDFTVKAWGIESEPTMLDETMDQLFEDATGGDLTIKATTSKAYQAGAGDSYWIR